MFREKEQLLYDAIGEIAEHIGHNIKNPISLSLLCLDLNLSFDDKGKIFMSFGKITRSRDFDDLNLQLFKKELISIVPEAQDYADVVVACLIKAFAKSLIPELYPYASVVDLELDAE